MKLSAIAPCLFLVAFSVGAKAEGEAPFDRVIEVGGQLWQTRIEVFHQHFEKHGFQWLSNSQASLRSVNEDLTLFGEKIGETIVRSDEGLVHRVDISIFNRGDQGSMAPGDFRGALKRWEAWVTEATKTKPEEGRAANDAAVGLTRVLWYTADSAILLESSVSRLGPEFMRLRLAPKPKGAFYLGNTTGRVHQQVMRADLRRNVKRSENGDVVIRGVPMVDQGPKGYCAVASAERVFRYYGLETDQHEMAQLASSSSEVGTNPLKMYEALKAASNGVQLRVYEIIQLETRDFFSWIEAYNREAKKQGTSLAPADPRRVVFLDDVYEALDPEVYLTVKSNRGNFFSSFKTEVMRTVDDGVPLLWAVYLGLYPEKDIPQARGGHMRLIIGYNQESGELIYSDSWGRGHEAKRMPIDQAFAMTKGLYTVKPGR